MLLALDQLPSVLDVLDLLNEATLLILNHLSSILFCISVELRSWLVLLNHLSSNHVKLALLLYTPSDHWYRRAKSTKAFVKLDGTISDGLIYLNLDSLPLLVVDLLSLLKPFLCLL